MSNRVDPDQDQVCKDYQQMTKVTAIRERVDVKKENKDRGRSRISEKGVQIYMKVWGFALLILSHFS